MAVLSRRGGPGGLRRRRGVVPRESHRRRLRHAQHSLEGRRRIPAAPAGERELPLWHARLLPPGTGGLSAVVRRRRQHHAGRPLATRSDPGRRCAGPLGRARPRPPAVLVREGQRHRALAAGKRIGARPGRGAARAGRGRERARAGASAGHRAARARRRRRPVAGGRGRRRPRQLRREGGRQRPADYRPLRHHAEHAAGAERPGRGRQPVGARRVELPAVRAAHGRRRCPGALRDVPEHRRRSPRRAEQGPAGQPGAADHGSRVRHAAAAARQNHAAQDPGNPAAALLRRRRPARGQRQDRGHRDRRRPQLRVRVLTRRCWPASPARPAS